ncbi:MAG: CcmD family protein [Myxococcota bacterium]|nr:CcmD family protein [Myxococcota bacterium]
MPETSTPAGSAPADRSTTFQAVQGEPEHYNGAALLVSAYAVLWIILLLWVGLVWRKQSALGARLDDLERVMKSAAAEGRKPSP